MLGGEAGEEIDDASVKGALEVGIGGIHAVEFQILFATLDHGLFDEFLEGNLAILLIGVVLDLFFVFGVLFDVAGNAEDVDPLFFGGDFPTAEEAIPRFNFTTVSHPTRARAQKFQKAGGGNRTPIISLEG